MHKSSARRTLRHYLLTGFYVLLMLCIVGVLAVAAYIAKIAPTTPDIRDLHQARRAEPSVLLSASGARLATYSRGQQERVSLQKVSPYVIQALLATEDHRFYDHRGIDMIRMVAATWNTMWGDAEGGSTITQQLVRNIFPEKIGRARTLERKLREIITALKIEQAFTKDQILETYLNSVPFLYSVIGIEMAARTYYDKHAVDLDALESATLVGMLKGTSYYNPVLNPERAQKRRNIVLSRMVKLNMLSESEYQSLREQPLQVKLTRQPDPLGVAPHFAGYARRFLLEWAEQNGYNLYDDGLVIESTIDDRLQQAAAEAVARQSQVLQDIADVEWGQSTQHLVSTSPNAYASLRRQVEPFRHFWDTRSELLDTFIRETPEYRKAMTVNKGQNKGPKDDAAVLDRLKTNARFMKRLRDSKARLEAGFVAIEPFSSEIKAWVGSRDFSVDQFDHVAQAQRQPGSTFKPIVYAAALEQGLSPFRTYPDGPVTIRSPDGSVWRPTDMEGASGRNMIMREGLIYSKNTITAQVMQDAGLPNVVRLARAVGIKQSILDPVPSLALGTSPVTLLEMVSAYATIAQVGEYRKPIFIKRIIDREGKVLAEFNTEGGQVMSEDTAVELIDMMRGVVRKGTGTAVRKRFGIAADIAGKTGTTQHNTDGWFILMHPNLVAGAWVGFNDARMTMRSNYWGQGGHNAILLVGDFFSDTFKQKLIDIKATFPQPQRSTPLIARVADVESRGDMNMPEGYGVVTRGDGSTVIVGPDGMQTIVAQDNGSRTGDELGRFLGSLENDAAVKGSGDSGTEGHVQDGGAPVFAAP